MGTRVVEERKEQTEGKDMSTQTKIPIATTLEVFCPTLPNFLILSTANGERGESVAVQNLTDWQLREIGKVWTQQLVKHAQSKRKK